MARTVKLDHKLLCNFDQSLSDWSLSEDYLYAVLNVEVHCLLDHSLFA